MANITFTDPQQIIQKYKNLPNDIHQKMDALEHSLYEKLTTHQIKNIVGSLMAKLHSGDFDEHDVHALHVFFEAYVKQRVNPPVITEKAVDTDTCKRARLISTFQKYGYQGKGRGVDTDKMRSFLDTPHAYPDGKRSTLTEDFGQIVHADDDMVIYDKNGKFTASIRGSRTNIFDKNFVKDWEFNARTIFSDKAGAEHLEKFQRQLETLTKAKEAFIKKYGEDAWKNAEILGYSQGGGNAIAIAEKLACKSITFNPHINALHNLHEAKMEHIIHRTAEDPATLFLAFKRFNDNIKIKTHGSLKNYDNALDSHNLSNFTDWQSPRSKYSKVHSSMNKISTFNSLVRENKLAGLTAKFGQSLKPDEYNHVVDHISVEDLVGDEQALRTKVQKIINPESMETRIHDVGTSAPGNNMPPPLPSEAGNPATGIELHNMPDLPAGRPTQMPPEPRIEPVP